MNHVTLSIKLSLHVFHEFLKSLLHLSGFKRVLLNDLRDLLLQIPLLSLTLILGLSQQIIETLDFLSKVLV